MQKIITDILKKNSYAVILNLIGLIGIMGNLYLVTKLYPLVETDRRLEYQVQAANIRIDNEKEHREQQDKYIVDKMNEFQKFNETQFNDIKILIRNK